MRPLVRLSPVAVVALVAVVAVVAAAPRAARAQYSVPSEVVTTGRVGSARSKASPELVRPGGWELGASLNFLTSEPSLGGRALDFTDVVLLRTHGLVSLGGAVELFGGADVLPKQPSYSDEEVWQGAHLGLRRRLGSSFAAWLRGEVGPQLGEGDGLWVGGDAAVQYKRSLEDVLYWESALGGSHTRVLADDERTGAWLAEVFAQTGVALRDPRGHFGTWLTFTFHFPVAHADGARGDGRRARELEPQTRVGFQLGGLVGISPAVDLFLEWSILDRGDLEDPATTLPILNGGFDQQQLVFGFMRRFGGGS